MSIGRKRFTTIFGPQAESLLESIAEISPDYANYVSEFLYGDLFARQPGLTDKSREIIVVACLIGKGNTGLPLKSHIKGMLNVGWSQYEVLELIIFMTAYAGFPNTTEALWVAKEVFAEVE